MFLPLSFAVPPSASTVSPVIATPDVNEAFVSQIGLNLIRIVKQDPTLLSKS